MLTNPAARRATRVLQRGSRCFTTCRAARENLLYGIKPPCDWDDAEAKEALVDALVRDGP